MITAPATPALRRAIPGFRGRQLSSAGRFADRHGCGGQGQTASQAQTISSRAPQARRGSSLGSDRLGRKLGYPFNLIWASLVAYPRLVPAIPFAILCMRDFPPPTNIDHYFLRSSCAGHISTSNHGDFNRHDANGLAGFAVDEVTANLPALTNGPIFGLSSAACVVALGLAVGIGRDDAMRHRAGKLFGKECFDVHGGNSNLVATNIGPLVLYVNRDLARSAA